VTNVDRDHSRWAQQWLPAAGVAIGIALIAGPFLATLIRSLLVWTGDSPHLSLGNFGNLFADPRFAGAAVNTLIAGVITTILSLTLGFSLAFLVSRTDMPGRSFLGTANLIPFFLSPYVGAISWIYLLAPHGGLITTWARNSFGISLEWLDIYSVGGVIFVLTLFYTPYVYLFVLPSLREMDAAFEDAARVHGATLWYTLRHITLPLVMPAMMSAGLIVFVTSAGLFDVPLALGAPRGIRFMPTEIYAMMQYPSDLGRAAAFGMVVLTVTVALTVWQRHFLAGRRFDTITGKGYRPRLIRLRWPARIAALSLEAIYVGGGVLLPLMALLMVSFSKLWTGRFIWRTATLANFDYILTKYDLTRTAISNSLILAISGATIGVILAVLQGYYLTRGNPRYRTLIDTLLSLPLGIPGIILGLGFLILALRTPLYSTLSIILIAYIARFLPFATRNVTAMFLAINPELEQSARTSGATWAQTMRHIVVPLLKPSLIASWLMLFVIFIRELGATILLYAQGTETISVAMVVLSERSSGYVAALAVVQLVMLLVAFTVFHLSRAPLAGASRAA
jgi:iron(III) transport system permease protein